VLVDDLCHQRAEGVQPVDMPGIHQHAVGQGARLLAAGLVCLVEQRANLGMLAQQQLVEMVGQGFATAFQQRHGGFDKGDLFSAKHRIFLWWEKPTVAVANVMQRAFNNRSSSEIDLNQGFRGFAGEINPDLYGSSEP